MKKYLAVLMLSATPVQADIVSTNDLTVINAPAVTVTSNFLGANSLPQQVIWAEQQNVILGSSLATDTGVIAAGTIVNSYFMALNRNIDGGPNQIANTSVTFDGNVLGIIYLGNANGVTGPNYAASDFLGAPGTNYQESGCLFCAFETFLGTDQGLNFDTATVTVNVGSFHNLYSYPGDFARIIVSAVGPGGQIIPVPGPLVGGGLPGLLALIGGFLWRRRQ